MIHLFSKAPQRIVVSIICFSLLLSGAVNAQATKAKPEELVKPAAEVKTAELNPKFFYFMNGKLPGYRGITLGDPKKWGASITGMTGTSASGKVKISPEDYQGKGDALQLHWTRKKVKGDMGIYGSPINIEAFKDAAALAFDVKVNTKPDKGVQIALDCGWPCRAEVEVGKQLRKLKKGQWTSFPIPINCFKSDNFDLKKINGVFVIATEGKLKLSIANIRLERLPDGSKGCAK